MYRVLPHRTRCVLWNKISYTTLRVKRVKELYNLILMAVGVFYSCLALENCLQTTPFWELSLPPQNMLLSVSSTITSMRKLMCLNVWLSLGNQINHIIGVLVFECSAYSRCGSWTFTWTFFAVTRCSVGGITIKTIQTDLAVKASSVVGTILSTNKLGRYSSKTMFQFPTSSLVFQQTANGLPFARSSVENKAKKNAIKARVWHTKPWAPISTSVHSLV